MTSEKLYRITINSTERFVDAIQARKHYEDHLKPKVSNDNGSPEAVTVRSLSQLDTQPPSRQAKAMLSSRQK